MFCNRTVCPSGIQGESSPGLDLLEVFLSQVAHCKAVKVAFRCLHHWV